MTERHTFTPTSSELAGRMVANGAILAALLAWAIAARGLPEFVLPGPIAVAQKLWGLVTEPALLAHVGTSFARVGAAVLTALLLALGLALLARQSIFIADILEHRVLVLLNSFPSVGWAILAILWLQVSNATVIFIEVMIVLPFCLTNVLQGFAALDPELEEMGRSFSRSRWRRLRLIELPLVAPYIVAAARISYGIAWKIALVAELFGAQTGLGFLLARAQASADAAMVFACCLLIVLIFGLVDRLILQRISRMLGAT